MGTPMRRTLAPLMLLGAFGACHSSDEPKEGDRPPVEVRCVPATRGDVDETVRLRGRLSTPPGGDLGVAAQVAGRIREIKVHEGDRVAKGAVVATVDDLAPRAAAKQAGAGVARAKSAEANARTALERIKTLAANGLASKAEVEDATAKAAAARADVEAEQASEQLATGNLGRVEVRSTFPGVVTKVWRGSGALVDGTAATPIVELASTSAVEFVADVTERELSRVREGQRAEVTLSTGTRLVGVVAAHSLALDSATGSGSVRVLLEPAGETDPKAPAAAPPLGSFGNVVIQLGRRAGVLSIPPSALRGAVLDGAEVAICKGDEAELRTISVGYRDAKRVEVTDGLKDGEKVAVNHVLGLENGTKIVEGKDGAEEEDGGGATGMNGATGKR